MTIRDHHLTEDGMRSLLYEVRADECRATVERIRVRIDRLDHQHSFEHEVWRTVRAILDAEGDR